MTTGILAAMTQALPLEQPETEKQAQTPDQAEAQVYSKAETLAESRRRELDEMRVISKRLDAFAPEAQKRILTWLGQHYAQEA